MKKILTIVALVVGQYACAQLKPHYTQYILNNYILNPALTGIENYTDLKLSMRDQWISLNGAPKTYYLSVHAPIGKKDYKTSSTSFGMPGENPRGTAYWESYTASEPHHGIGATVVNDETGNFSRFTANLSYAYHLGLNERTNLAMGFSAGITRVGYDRSKATPADPSDPLVLNGNNEVFKIRPDVNVGLWLYSGNYFLGLSAQQVIPQTVKFDTDIPSARLVPHLFLTAGYRLLVSEDVNAIPSLMAKYVSPLNPQVDLNLKLQFRDLLWMGGSYRLENGFSGMVGLNVANTFNVGYAYDFTKSDLGTVSKGTHEIIIGFLLGNKYGDTCPRNVW